PAPDAHNADPPYPSAAHNRLEPATTEAGTTRYEYWEDGLFKTIRYPNGVVADSSGLGAYDAADRLTHLVNVDGGGGIISSYDYTYDRNGNRKTQTEAHVGINLGLPETTPYDHDHLNRLLHVGYATTSGLTSRYDNVGTRRPETGVDPVTAEPVSLSYAYDRLNRLASVTNLNDAFKSVAFSYDANGNR